MELKDYSSGDLVIELLHRTDVDVVFLEKNDNAFIDVTDVKGYTIHDNISVNGAAIILIHKSN